MSSSITFSTWAANLLHERGKGEGKYYKGVAHFAAGALVGREKKRAGQREGAQGHPRVFPGKKKKGGVGTGSKLFSEGPGPPRREREEEKNGRGRKRGNGRPPLWWQLTGATEKGRGGKDHQREELIL